VCFKYIIAKYPQNYEYPVKTVQIHGFFLNLLWCGKWTPSDFWPFFGVHFWCYIFSQLDFSDISIVYQQHLLNTVMVVEYIFHSSQIFSLYNENTSVTLILITGLVKHGLVSFFVTS
jgi:hypothetical protein